ncbi:MAG: ABC transporter ATP-binding protein [Hyphomicrobiales bacterium]
MSEVEIRDVTKAYGATRALDGVTLTVGNGEFFGLLGPSGSGKTTLLRAIAGFVPTDSGTILFDGEPVESVPVHRRNIGMVFQSYALFPHLTVAQNVAFGLDVRSIDRSAQEVRVTEMLEMVRLKGYEARKPHELSGGQQQRVALARALATRPRVLLLDEPLGALDRRLRQEMQIELKDIQRELGITTIFVTHDQEEALTLSDRIAILSEGRLVQVGKPYEVYERPATVFAAQFLGDANIFRGDAKGPLLTLADGTVIRTAGPSGGIAVVRPEKMRIAEGTPPRGHNTLSGEIVQETYTGASVTYRIRCAALGDTPLLVFAQNATGRYQKAGERVTVTWEPSQTMPVTP